ncbi:MAG: transcriptional regulator [Promethearchaeota archaeon]
MELPCETAAKYVFPIFKSIVAKELVQKYNFTQTAAAEKLGTTQAAISQYIHSKRGYRRDTKQLREILPVIQAVACKTADQIAAEDLKTDEVIPRVCGLCMLARRLSNISIRRRIRSTKK